MGDAMGLAFRIGLIALFLIGLYVVDLQHPGALRQPQAVAAVAALGVLLLASLLEEGRAGALSRRARRRRERGDAAEGDRPPLGARRESGRGRQSDGEEARQTKGREDFWRRCSLAGRALAVNLAVWCLIVAGFATAYLHRAQIRETALIAYSALQPGEPVTLSASETVLTSDRGGHFTTTARINGERVRMLVDTGSSDVALPYEEAERLGVDVTRLRFTRPVMTANGQAMVAPVVLPEVTVGPITLKNVKASVAEPGRLASPLLGMSFLGQLSEVSIRGDKLRLKS